jgi:hypothetical protein
MELRADLEGLSLMGMHAANWVSIMTSRKFFMINLLPMLPQLNKHFLRHIFGILSNAQAAVSKG